MDIISVSINSSNLIVSANILLSVIVIIAFVITILIFKYFKGKTSIFRELTINEVELGIGNNSRVVLKYDDKDKQVAYTLWVEISTRKIGEVFNRDKDVIVEVYDSWYKFFNMARELLEEIPVSKIKYREVSNLVEVSIEMLNKCIRPHLTEWQAKFRKWYVNSLNNEDNLYMSPQEIQSKYPDYDKLVNDIINVNKQIEEYTKILYSIAFTL